MDTVRKLRVAAFQRCIWADLGRRSHQVMDLRFLWIQTQIHPNAGGLASGPQRVSVMDLRFSRKSTSREEFPGKCHRGFGNFRKCTVLQISPELGRLVCDTEARERGWTLPEAAIKFPSNFHQILSFLFFSFPEISINFQLPYQSRVSWVLFRDTLA